MSKHTPGPWHIRHCDDALHMNMTVVSCMDWGRHNSGQYQSEDDTICVVFHQMDPLVSDQLDDFGEANATLIAAAPDLLEAMRGLYDAVEADDGVAWWHMDKAKRAIAKARGEP